VRKAALALSLLLTACGSSREDAYRGQLECFAVHEMMENRAETSRQASEQDLQAAGRLETNYKRLLDSARQLGKSPADVVADAHSFMNKIDWSNSHGTEEYLDQVMSRCSRTSEH
jgi:hypothetical protein